MLDVNLDNCFSFFLLVQTPDYSTEYQINDIREIEKNATRKQ